MTAVWYLELQKALSAVFNFSLGNFCIKLACLQVTQIDFGKPFPSFYKMAALLTRGIQLLEFIFMKQRAFDEQTPIQKWRS